MVPGYGFSRILGASLAAGNRASGVVFRCWSNRRQRLKFFHMRRSLFIIGVLWSAVLRAGAAEYEISYLWHHDLAQVERYREQVARVLGPDVGAALRVVRGGGSYGLIYDRRGDRRGAVKVAKAHTRLLSARGLEPAAPIPSRNWQPVGYGKRKTSDEAGWVVGDSRGVEANRYRVPSAAAAPHPRRRVPHLERAVDRYIKQLRQHGKIAPDERTAWSVLDFTTGEQLVSINEDVQLQAASLVKPFFALAFFHKVKQGELIYGPKSRRHMERMIQRSSNKSSNWVMRHVGGPAAVQKILARHYPAIFEETRIVEYIPASGRTYRNKASVNDYSRFLSALWKEELPGSREIKRLMMLPGPDRLFTGVSELPDGTTVYNKTGSTSRLCGDMGILVVEGEDGRSYPYTLVGVIEKKRSASNYTSWIRSRADVIRDVSDIVYRGISEHHKLHSSL